MAARSASSVTDGEKMIRPKSKFNFRDFVVLIGQVKPKYWQLMVGLTIGLVASAAQLAVPTFAQSLINSLRSQVNGQLIALVVGLFVAGMLLNTLSATLLGFFGENVVAKLRDTLWDKLLRLPVSYFDEQKAGEISSRLVNDSTQVKDLLATTFPNFVTAILQIVGSLAIMLLMDWKMTLIMFLAIPLMMLVMLPLMTRTRAIGFARQNAMATFNGKATETLGAVRLVKSSGAEKFERQSGKADVRNLYQIGRKEAIYTAVAQPVMGGIMMALVIGILGYGAVRVLQGSMTIGMLIAFLMYLFQIMQPATQLGSFFSELAKTSGSTERIAELLTADEENQTAGQLVNLKGQSLTMNHVNFEYEPGHEVLHDVSFTAKPNTVVAFAGPSGGGKSTIFGLLERFYDPTSGTIKVGNTDVATINLVDWRRQIGLVSQDSAIMAGTIRFNLTYGLTGHFSDGQLWRVLKMAYADEFVRQMTDGLETQVGERGVKVSGGQRQRIAIARAFLRDPQLLMLDEATASLDSESEMMVQKALEKLMEGRTTLIIAHRLSTIVDADNIYFIQNGRVTGSGTHEQLIASLPLYKEYVENQMRSDKVAR